MHLEEGRGSERLVSEFDMQAGRQGGVGVVFSASVVLCLKVEWNLGLGQMLRIFLQRWTKRLVSGFEN